MKKLLLLFALTMFVFVACGPNEPVAAPESEAPPEQSGEAAGLPNPASVYCEEHGYTVEMREGEGGSYGVCLFPDGSECDEWAYWRGECRPGDSLATRKTAAEMPVAPAEDGCQLYQNEALGYTFHFPADAAIELGDDPLHTVTIVGPLTEEEHWPVIYVNHPQGDEAYRPPEGVDLAQWMVDHFLLALSDEEPAAEVRQADVEIAGSTAVHVRFERSPQSYAYDKYAFTHGDQLFVVVILHAGDREDWDLYQHFLENFRFTS